MSTLTDAHLNGDCLSPCHLCDLDDAYAYDCRACGRRVVADQEPSPGEPTTCPDCYDHALKELGRW